MMTTMDIIYENLKSKSFLFANLAPRILFIPFLKINFLLFFLFVFVFLFCFFVCSTVNLLKWIHTRTEISFLMTFLVVTFPHNIDTLRIVNFCEFFFSRNVIPLIYYVHFHHFSTRLLRPFERLLYLEEKEIFHVGKEE